MASQLFSRDFRLLLTVHRQQRVTSTDTHPYYCENLLAERYSLIPRNLASDDFNLKKCCGTHRKPKPKIMPPNQDTKPKQMVVPEGQTFLKEGLNDLPYDPDLTQRDSLVAPYCVNVLHKHLN